MPPTGENSIFKPDLKLSPPLPKALASTIDAVAGRLFALSRLDEVYWRSRSGEQGREESQVEFLDRVLEHLGVGYDCRPGELERLPAKGPVVVVANHPYGALEGIVLARLLLNLRPDIKIMANYLLSRIPEIRDLFVFVDPFESNGSVDNNFRPLRDAVRWLEGDGMLAVFPAGEVAHMSWGRWRVKEPPWNPVVAGIARRAKASVVPVYFSGHNGLAFQLAGMVHPRLRTALLPRELVNKRGRQLTLRIGNPISYQRLATRPTSRHAAAYLQKRTQLLRLGLKERDGKPGPSCQDGPSLTPPRRTSVLAAEVECLPPNQKLLASGDFTVLYAYREQIPRLMDEIGRVREVCFRQVGEGTGRERDIDHFDDYYAHLCLWNHKRRELAGGYRLGQVDEIIAKKGIDGLYTSTLFDYRPAFFQRLAPALELGRSFVHPDYQRSYSGLMLLWKGIGHFIACRPRYRYLFGPVSISNSYHPLSKRLMQQFLARHHASPLSDLVQPRKPPRFMPRPELSPRKLLKGVQDLDELNEIVSDIQANGWGVPILVKQYLKLGALSAAWNVDPEFGQVLDCLMVADLMDADIKTLTRYMGKKEVEAFRRLHGGEQDGNQLVRCA